MTAPTGLTPNEPTTTTVAEESKSNEGESNGRTYTPLTGTGHDGVVSSKNSNDFNEFYAQQAKQRQIKWGAVFTNLSIK